MLYRYEVASNLVSDSECQSKAVCELSRNKGRFGSSRAIQESLNLIDVVQYFNLPDGILEVLDEFQVKKSRTFLFHAFHIDPNFFRLSNKAVSFIK